MIPYNLHKWRYLQTDHSVENFRYLTLAGITVKLSLTNKFIIKLLVKFKNSTCVVTTRLSHSHLFDLLIYTHFLYFNRIKIYTRLITHDS